MEKVYRIILLVAGIINFAPSILAFIPSRFSKSYGILIPDANFELLLRHRAILFALVGGFMIWSAITKNEYNLSTVLGLISMFSFVMLYFLVGGTVNEQLAIVMKIDLGAVILLGTGFLLYKFNS